MAHQQRRPVSITLSAVQVDEVMRAAAQGGSSGIAMLIAASRQEPAGRPLAQAAADRTARPEPDDRRLSRSLLRGLSLLACFDPDGEERGIVELARELGMSPGTAHRYAVTLVELGLLERCPRTRKYRLPAG
jgi:IclR helix-turn-helix domain